MKRIANKPPAKAYVYMAEMCYKHYLKCMQDKDTEIGTMWLIKAQAYREKAGQFGHEMELSDANK